jgi:hypothetical protein
MGRMGGELGAGRFAGGRRRSDDGGSSHLAAASRVAAIAAALAVASLVVGRPAAADHTIAGLLTICERGSERAGGFCQGYVDGAVNTIVLMWLATDPDFAECILEADVEPGPAELLPLLRELLATGAVEADDPAPLAIASALRDFHRVCEG